MDLKVPIKLPPPKKKKKTGKGKQQSLRAELYSQNWKGGATERTAKREARFLTDATVSAERGKANDRRLVVAHRRWQVPAPSGRGSHLRKGSEASVAESLGRLNQARVALGAIGAAQGHRPATSASCHVVGTT